MESFVKDRKSALLDFLYATDLKIREKPQILVKTA
jgi:hypothetical protein